MGESIVDGRRCWPVRELTPFWESRALFRTPLPQSPTPAWKCFTAESRVYSTRSNTHHIWANSFSSSKVRNDKTCTTKQLVRHMKQQKGFLSYGLGKSCLNKTSLKPEGFCMLCTIRIPRAPEAVFRLCSNQANTPPSDTHRGLRENIASLVNWTVDAVVDSWDGLRAFSPGSRMHFYIYVLLRFGTE